MAQNKNTKRVSSDKPGCIVNLMSVPVRVCFSGDVVRFAAPTRYFCGQSVTQIHTNVRNPTCTSRGLREHLGGTNLTFIHVTSKRSAEEGWGDPLVTAIKKKGRINWLERCSNFRGGGRSLRAVGCRCERWDWGNWWSGIPHTDIFHSLPICKPPALISNGFFPVVLHLSEHAHRRMDGFCSIC